MTNHVPSKGNDGVHSTWDSINWFSDTNKQTRGKFVNLTGWEKFGTVLATAAIGLTVIGLIFAAPIFRILTEKWSVSSNPPNTSTCQKTNNQGIKVLNKKDKVQIENLENFKAGVNLINEGRYEEAASFLQKAAKNEYAPAQSKLGQLYETENGVEQDYKKAVNLYQKAADKNDAKGLACLGLCYLKGIGVIKDENKAVSYLTSAANQDYGRAQYNLAICYAKGIGVELNFDKAINLLHRASENGDDSAQCYLGSLYEEGKYVNKSYQEALRFYELAALQGNSDANERLLGLNRQIERSLYNLGNEPGVKQGSFMGLLDKCSQLYSHISKKYPLYQLTQIENIKSLEQKALLVCLAAKNDDFQLIQLLNEADADIKNNINDIAHWLLENNELFSDELDFMIRIGLDVDAKDKLGRTLLYKAVDKQDLVLVRSLVARGVNKSLAKKGNQNEEALTPLELAKAKLIEKKFLSQKSFAPVRVSSSEVPKGVRKPITIEECEEIIKILAN